MDVLSMQIANKVRKRMDTEYGGIYETCVATAGQKTVSTVESFATNGHLLKVYVDGVLAILDKDYAIQDDKTVVFTEGLTEGNIVLLTTEVVGIPRFSVINPPYDDTDLKNKIGDIIAALDDDGDGSIIDTINNIKIQWQNADSDLQNLIANKVDQAVVDAITAEILSARSSKSTLKARLDEIVALIPAAYDDTAVKSDILNIKTDIQNVQSSISTNQTNITGLQTSMGIANTDITDLKAKVANIITVLDEDADGSILDALTDLKAQWQSADGDLQNLINGKADNNAVTALDGRVNALETSQASNELVDEVTGWKYTLKVVSGTLTAELIKVLENVLLSRAGSGSIFKGATEQFTASSEYQDGSNATSATAFTFAVDDNTVATINGQGLLSAIKEGNVNVILTGTIKDVQKQTTIPITIIISDAEKVLIAKGKLDLGDLSAITSNITLPVIQNECSVSWTSNNVAYITNSGVVTRPRYGDVSANVNLTATVTLNADSDTKVFTATVIERPINTAAVTYSTFDASADFPTANYAFKADVPGKDDFADNKFMDSVLVMDQAVNMTMHTKVANGTWDDVAAPIVTVNLPAGTYSFTKIRHAAATNGGVCDQAAYDGFDVNSTNFKAVNAMVTEYYAIEKTSVDPVNLTIKPVTASEADLRLRSNSEQIGTTTINL